MYPGPRWSRDRTRLAVPAVTLLQVAVVAGVAFVVTNLDTFVFLAAVLAVGDHQHAAPAVAGEVLGFLLVLGLVLSVALGLGTVPGAWVGLVGLVPIAVGVTQLRRSGGGEPDEGTGATSVSVAAISAAVIGHGVDNVAVLAPFLRSRTAAELLVACGTFVVLNAVLCSAAYLLADRRRVRKLAASFGDRALPWIYIGVGLLVVAEAIHTALS